jgi:hypothetical protein
VNTGSLDTSYRIALPPPWTWIPLNKAGPAIDRILDDLVARTPKSVPPDRIGPRRRELERSLITQAERAREHGGIDLYLPIEPWHGFLVPASFLVATVTPDVIAHDDGDVGPLLAELLRSREGATAVTVADTVWIRSARRAEADPNRSDGINMVSERVEYFTAVPGDPRRWVVVTFSTAFDDSALLDGVHDKGPHEKDSGEMPAQLLVEWFDAVMSTWRWVRSGRTEATNPSL